MKRGLVLFVIAGLVATGIVAAREMWPTGSVESTAAAPAPEPQPDLSERRLAVPPNPKSTWRASFCGMCCALPTESGYRIWATGREPADGLFCIGWIDVDHDLNVIDEAKEPALRPEPQDTKGVLMPCVLDCGDHHRMYFTGQLPGLAFSKDGGKTWERHPEPILRKDAIDTWSLGTNCVVRDGETWRTFYTSVLPGTKVDGFLINRFIIRYAESPDGIHWTKPESNVALDADPTGTSARPCVWKEGQKWRMLYSRAPAMIPHGGREYRIHLAESSDGIHFREAGEVLLPTRRSGEFDSAHVEYAWYLPGEPSRFLYSADGFGRTGIGVATFGNLRPPKPL